MDFRLAAMDNLSQIKKIYKDIIVNMNTNNIYIWDEIYPCEFFESDIKNNRLYILINNNSEIVSAFALNHLNNGSDSLNWKDKNAEALYIDRLGVNVNYLRKGIGKIMLNKAIHISRQMNAEYLRLFVVNNNYPAINLYRKVGFEKADGIYDEVIDEDFVLHEFGFEIKTSL